MTAAQPGLNWDFTSLQSSQQFHLNPPSLQAAETTMLKIEATDDLLARLLEEGRWRRLHAPPSPPAEERTDSQA